MNILILGGTKFVGRHISLAMLAAGHRVTVFTRGTSPDELPAEIERLHGDRNNGPEGLAALNGRKWDACIDVSGYTPRQVRPSAEFLADKVGRYLFISTVSVYGGDSVGPITEESPILPPADEDVTEINGETYGPLKVTCEQIVQEVFGHPAVILRPQIVAGPFDHTGRFPYWINRAALGTPMLAPGDGTDFVQMVDARDIARFAVRLVENGIGGVFNMAGERLRWDAFLAMLGADKLVWVPANHLAEIDFNLLPLYRAVGSSFAALMDVSSALAQKNGFQITPMAETTRDTREWCLGRTFDVGLPPEMEAELMEKAASST